MKKNFTINLFGALYNMDEDAYDLLNHYQENMKRYFSKREGGDEIADDIEHRIAELMADLKAQGVEAITIEHVEDIIRRIGSPEELELNDDETENDACVHRKTARKKLYRNPDDCKVGGVVGGLACFWGADSMALRILMAFLIILSSGWGLIAYLLAWIIIPVARTPEDMLRMRGETVNMENMGEEILNGNGRGEAYVSAPQSQSTARGCLSSVMDVFVVLFKLLIFGTLGGLALVLVFVLFCVLFCIGVMLYATIAGFGSFFFHNADVAMLHTLENLPLMATIGFWIAAISLLVMLSVSIYMFVHWLGRLWGNGRVLAPRTRFVLFVVWLVSLVLFGVFTTTTSIAVSKNYQMKKQEYYSINGFYVPKEEFNYLKQNGWSVVAHKNCSDDYLYWGSYYNNDGQRYLHSRNVNGLMEYQLEKKESVTPGIYRLEAVGRTDGAGAYIYAQLGDVVYKQEIPVYGDEQGGIWMDAQQRIAAGGLSVSDSIRYYDIYERNYGRGNGWSRVVVDSIVVDKPGELRYGVSNVPTFTDKPWRGTWLSAHEFTLTRLKDDVSHPKKSAQQ